MSYTEIAKLALHSETKREIQNICGKTEQGIQICPAVTTCNKMEFA